ncbi:MAG: TfoX/Sxy family protein [Anaerolineae bacterium]|nr:TfoX/Sxy family protein [Anaerolineae bacterium]
MAYDEEVVKRVREIMRDTPGFSERKMFGGVGFMLHGNMAGGVNKDDLIVRVGPDGYEDALSQPHARFFDMTGRPMKGWVAVGPSGYESDQDLAGWVRRGTEFALSLPPK